MKRRVLPILILPLLMMSSCVPTETSTSTEEHSSSFAGYLTSVESLSKYAPESIEDVTYYPDAVYAIFTPSFSEEIRKNGLSHLKVLEETHPNLLAEEATEEYRYSVDDKLWAKIPLRNQEEEEAFKTAYVLNHDIRVYLAFINSSYPNKA